MPEFRALGEDLANIVCDFAFQTSYRVVFFSLKTVLEIKCFDVPKTLVRWRIFSPKYLRFIDNPIIVFEPLSSFEDWRALFDWNEIYCRLWHGLPAIRGEVLWLPWSVAFAANSRMDVCFGLHHVLPGASGCANAHLQAQHIRSHPVRLLIG